jgi:hypothetical protein
VSVTDTVSVLNESTESPEIVVHTQYDEPSTVMSVMEEVLEVGEDHDDDEESMVVIEPSESVVVL